MSGGGPPHHPHNRHVPPTNTAWNPLSVPGYFPRQPQVAHMQSEHPILHQPTWHTPTTSDAMKMIPHTPMFNEMFKSEALFPRDCVDLSLTKNVKKTFLGNQNGELASTPAAISLSVRDASKINSLPPGMLDIQAVELTKCASPNLKSAVSPGSIRSTSMSPGLKATSPGLLTSGPGLKSHSPGRKSLSPAPKSASPGLNLSGGVSAVPSTASVTLSLSDGNKTNPKRSNIRVDSILERLNPIPEKTFPFEQQQQSSTVTVAVPEKSQLHHTHSNQSVIVQASSNYDENSNSSGTTSAPTPKEEDSASMHSNEDSLDSTKSRRKRKPSKTVRVNKEEENVKTEGLPTDFRLKNEKEKPTTLTASIIAADPKKPASLSDTVDGEPKDICHRKVSSESETIDNIAAMVQEGLKDKVKETKNNKDSSSLKPELVEKEADVRELSKFNLKGEDKSGYNNESDVLTQPLIENAANEVAPQIVQPLDEELPTNIDGLSSKPVIVSVIKSKENLEDALFNDGSSESTKNSIMPVVTAAQKKASSIHFVEVENKLEEMFAGIVEDPVDTTSSNALEPPVKNDATLGLTDDSLFNSSSVKNEVDILDKKLTRNSSSKSDLDEVPAKKKKLTKTKASKKALLVKIPAKKTPSVSVTNLNKAPIKSACSSDLIKDVYAYDSGSNASSSRSRGPFVQIRGPRDSPLSVSVVNAPLNGDEDGERKPSKHKKFHDDSEYRHKVRSKGLHCSTLSTKYDAERKDATWICAFCKRGPHASELSGPSVISDVPPPGDLFGPYFITAQCPEFERRLDDPYDRQFKSRKITKVLDANNAKATTSKKHKRKSESSPSQTALQDIYLGITDTNGTAITFEVWTHEDCMVWSPGVYLVGPKIAGLEEAVWTCSNVSCVGCGLKGANVACCKRGCLASAHVCCARRARWQMDEGEFKAFCPEHWR